MAAIEAFDDDDHLAPRQPRSWAALEGRWRFLDDSVVYLGPGEAVQSAPLNPLGMALCDLPFSGGVAQAKLRLSNVAPRASAGGIVFGYSSLSERYYLAQIGAYGTAYDISVHTGSGRFESLTRAGSIENLAPNTDYSLELRLHGQSVQVAVDGIPVLSWIVPPVNGSSLGLFCWGPHEVQFSEFGVSSTPPSVFVIMRFGEPYDSIYRDVIKPVAEDQGFEVRRIDEYMEPGIILNDIHQRIQSANVVIAEISANNANVYYELGYADAKQKPLILLWRRETGKQLPFDIAGKRAIFYDDTIAGKRLVEDRLRQTLQAVRRGMA